MYSTRPCKRIAPYEWDFGAAKLTDINRPAGIVQRRGSVVVAINTALREAGIDKRYTPLSNRDRGMKPAVRGKVGQQATWKARRVAALEDRKARLLAMKEQVRRLREGMRDAAARLASARTIVARRSSV